MPALSDLPAGDGFASAMAASVAEFKDVARGPPAKPEIRLFPGLFGGNVTLH